MSRVLIVEDEEHLARGLKFNLEAEGIDAEVVGDGESGLQRLLHADSGIDAVILDVMLPGISGFEVVSQLRNAKQYVPVLMLTARGRPEDVLRGFEAGVDDYLPKPFELAILVARLRGLIRRKRWASGVQTSTAQDSGSNSEEPSTFSFDGKSIDFPTLELRLKNETIQLTVMEAELLRHLIRNEGKAVSRKSILEDVWSLREDTDTRAIDNFIVRLRRYIEAVPSKPKHLLTVRGVGYKFIANPK
ncbi:MAG: DNA-binding response regulator [Acidobacteria bacterium]|nr:MAG: DNA-binding response regulator [Acidobacteriota bacterium]PYY16497.1 MAG: DNA-binding response regulator [Acidobacteriota bacterium]